MSRLCQHCWHFLFILIWNKVHDIIHLAVQHAAYLFYRLKRNVYIPAQTRRDIRTVSSLLLELCRSHITLYQHMEKFLVGYGHVEPPLSEQRGYFIQFIMSRIRENLYLLRKFSEGFIIIFYSKPAKTSSGNWRKKIASAFVNIVFSSPVDVCSFLSMVWGVLLWGLFIYSFFKLRTSAYSIRRSRWTGTVRPLTRFSCRPWGSLHKKW